MKKALIVVALFSFVSLIGCQTMFTVNYDVDKTADFSKYKTFALAPPPTETPPNLPGYSELTAQLIQGEIANQMELKGYKEVPINKAGLVLAFSVSGEPRTDVWGSTGGGYGYGWYGGGAVMTTHYTVGTLVIQVYDGQARKVVWHGWATTQFFAGQTDDDGLKKGIAKLLKDYPAVAD